MKRANVIQGTKKKSERGGGETMEIILIGGSNDGEMLMVADDINSLEMFLKSMDGTEREVKRERYHKQTFRTMRKEFNLFAVEGMDSTMVMQTLIDRYVK
jgi:hypothetical protein